MPSKVLRLIPDRAHVRMLIGAGAGVVGGLVVWGQALPVGVLTGWNSCALILLSLNWAGIWKADAEETKRRSGSEDPGRRLVWVLVTVASAFSLFAATVMLRQARRLAPDSAAVWIVLCLAAVGLSWLLTHTLWALRYAHIYYRNDSEGVGGLTFPGDGPPDAFDFAYFAFTIGICFQTSDVAITSRQIRRSVLFHAALSFAYTTAIIALALNLAFGFFS